MSKELNEVMSSLRDWLALQIKDLNGNSAESKDETRKVMEVATELLSSKKADVETILE